MRFQSLLGFRRLWSSTLASMPFLAAVFQSLLGFRRLWSFRKKYGSLSSCVSIPIRVSEALKLSCSGHSLNLVLFQSLLGFRRLWSTCLPPQIVGLSWIAVSIPIRVSEALKPWLVLGNYPLTIVSIPIRVSEALKPSPIQSQVKAMY